MAKAAGPDLPALQRNVITEIPIGLLSPDPGNPRTEFPAADLEQLAADLKVQGVKHPLEVSSDYVIKDGHRRWRAAQMARFATVPCVLAAPQSTDGAEYERQLDQVAVNHHAEKLTTMDLARFLRKLVDVHGMQVKDIPALLEKRGIAMSRPYVSNIMRLVDLPDWAQKMITDGTLKPADGKLLLPAVAHPPAIEWLKKELTRAARVNNGEKEEENERAEAVELSAWTIRRAFRDTAIEFEVESYSGKKTRFPFQKDCAECNNRLTLGRSVHDGWFCLNPKCYNKKQAEAPEKQIPQSNTSARPKPKKPAGPTVVNPKSIDKDGVIDATRLAAAKYEVLEEFRVNFEPDVICNGCTHRRQARLTRYEHPSTICLNPPCFADKQRNGNRQEAVALWLDRRILDQVLALLKGNEEVQFQLVAWMALDGKTANDSCHRVNSKLRGEQRDARHALKLHHIGAVVQACDAQSLNIGRIAEAGARALLEDRGNFYALARYLGAEVTPANAGIDAEYLSYKRKSELLELAQRSGLNVGSDLAKQKTEKILEFVGSAPVVKAIGVPPDIKALWEHITPKVDLSEIEDDEDETEEDE